jgi:hypothetical protein
MFFFVVWILRRKSRLLTYFGAVVIVPILVAALLDTLLSIVLGQVTGIGNVTLQSAIVTLPSIDKMGVIDFFLESYWLAVNFGAGIAVMIALLAPISYAIGIWFHRLYLRAKGFMLDEQEQIPPFWSGQVARSGGLFDLVAEGTRSFSMTSFLRFLMLSFATSILIFVAFILSGGKVTTSATLLGQEFLVPAFVGYLDVGQLIVATLFVYDSVGNADTYKFYVKLVLSVLSLPTFISLVRSPVLASQILDLLLTIPILYFRNSLMASVCTLILMPQILKSAARFVRHEGLSAFVLPRIAVFLFLGLPTIQIVVGPRLTGGIPTLVYLAIGNIAFPTVSLAFLVLVLLLRLKHGQSNLRILAWLLEACLLGGIGYFLTYFLPVPIPLSRALLPGDAWVLIVPLALMGGLLLRRRTAVGMMLVGLSFIIAQAFFVDWVLLFIIPPTILIAESWENRYCSR